MPCLFHQTDTVPPFLSFVFLRLLLRLTLRVCVACRVVHELNARNFDSTVSSGRWLVECTLLLGGDELVVWAGTSRIGGEQSVLTSYLRLGCRMCAAATIVCAHVPDLFVVACPGHAHFFCFAVRIPGLLPLFIYYFPFPRTPLPAAAVYAPWCSSCRSFAPTYDAVARAIAASPTGGNVRVARVDGWTYSVLSRRFRVNAFPSFVVLQGGYVYEHTGRWTPNGLLKFALPPPLRVLDLAAAAAAQTDGGGNAAAADDGSDSNSDGDGGTTTGQYTAVAAQEDVVVNGERVDRPFGPMAPHWRLATYLSAVGGDIAAAGRDLSTVQLGGVVVGSGMALTFVIVLGLAVLTTPGVFKFD